MGATLGYWGLRGQGDLLKLIVLAFTTGTLIVAIVEEILPEAHQTDRLGKGIRTGARDALLSDEATPDTKGRVFSFHRSMDTFGAVLGPSLALIYLAYHPDDYKKLFYIAFSPGLIRHLYCISKYCNTTREFFSWSYLVLCWRIHNIFIKWNCCASCGDLYFKIQELVIERLVVALALRVRQGSNKCYTIIYSIY